MSIIDWIARLARYGDTNTGGTEAVTKARERLVDEYQRTKRANSLAERAILSRQANHYAQALRAAYGGRRP